MKNRILSGWNFMRVLRLFIGVFILAQGIMAHDWLMGIMGAAFSLMPLLNIGCCATGNCAVNKRRSAPIAENTEDITYEEVH